MSDNYHCLVIGETGVGKSSFINTITKTNECPVGNEGKACTTDYKMINIQYKGRKFVLVDTPGLNDAKGDMNNIQTIKSAISDYPHFHCVLLLMLFQSNRLSDSMVQIIKKFIEIFPLKQFWKHVIIVRTHAEKGRSFEKQKKNIEGSIVKCLNEKEFEKFKNFMKDEKKIDLPITIDEFYVDCPGKEDDYSYNEDEFDKIFNKIMVIPKMFKDIKTIKTEEMDESGAFPILRIKRTLIYIDTSGREISIGPELFKEIEKANYRVIKTKERKQEVETRSNCGKVEIKYDYYETKIYKVNGKEVAGKECFVKSQWEKKK